MRISRQTLYATLTLSLAPQTIGAVVYTENLDRCLTAEEADEIESALANGETVDIFPDKVQPDQSSYWDISYHGTYKILKNTQPDVDTSYLLHQCGLPMPLTETEREQFDGVFEVPYSGGLLVTATTTIPNIEILGRRSQIKAFAVDENLISSPCLSQVVIPAGKDDGSITFLPLYNDTAIEEYVIEHPDTVVFGGGFDTNKRSPKQKIIISSVGESPQLAKENGRDINQAIFEWLEVYGSMFNQERLAKETVEETAARYECHAENAAILSEERQRRRQLQRHGRDLHAGKHPVVLWAYHTQEYDGTDVGWDVGECPNYYCTYATHCHVEILNSTAGSVDRWGYTYMTDEEFMEFGKNADVWVYPSSDWNRLIEQKADFLSQFKSVQTKEVYDFQMSGKDAWFEQRLAEYDTVLLDMCDIVDRDVPTDPPHVRKWFRNVFDDGVGSLGTCSNDDEEYMPRVTECVRADETPESGINPEPSSTSSRNVVDSFFLCGLLLGVWSGS